MTPPSRRQPPDTDTVSRKVANELLANANKNLVGVTSDIHRCAHHFQEGLTDKEYQYAMKLYKDLCATQQRFTNLTNRLRKSS